MALGLSLGACAPRLKPAKTADGKTLFRLGFSGAPDHAVDRLLDSGCFFDTAVLAADQPAAEPRRLMSEWPADRLLFGTDYYWTSQRQLVDWVTSLRPDPADREKIFHLNAERLLA